MSFLGQIVLINCVECNSYFLPFFYEDVGLVWKKIMAIQREFL